MGKINKKAILLNDVCDDKKTFYAKVKKVVNDIKFIDLDIESNIELNGDIVDRDIRKLYNIKNTLYKEHDCGLSLLQMYRSSNAILSKNDARYEEFFKFKSRNIFETYKFENLKRTIDNLNEEKITAFSNYNKIKTKNTFLEDIDLKLNTTDADEMSKQIKITIELIKSITGKGLENKEIYETILAIFNKKGNSFDDRDIVEYAKAENIRKNSDLLKSLNNGSKWSISYWKNFSKNKKQEEDNHLLYMKREKKLISKTTNIYKLIYEGIEQLQALKIYLNERAYNLIIKDFLLGESIISYLEDILKAFEYVKVNKEEINTVLSLNSIEEKILRSCYNKDKNIIKKNIANLLEFVSINNILNIEKKSYVNDCLKQIDEFEDLLNNINKGLESKTNIVEDIILIKWDNKANSYIKKRYLKILSTKQIKRERYIQLKNLSKHLKI